MRSDAEAFQHGQSVTHRGCRTGKQTADCMLKEFRSQRYHMAIVTMSLAAFPAL